MYEQYNAIMKVFDDRQIHSQTVFYHEFAGFNLELIFEELQNIGWIKNTQSHIYIATQKYFDFKKATPPEYSGREYEYYKYLEQNSSALKEKTAQKQNQILDLTITDLVDKIMDQPKMKNRLLRAELIAGVSALGAILSAIAALKGR